VNVASERWLRDISEVCRKHGVLLIIDDIQTGNGRTGSFFSFESSGIEPDLVCVSKSIGGGLPMSLVLIKPEFDCWQPGEHTGTFRGNNLAFVAAQALLEAYWSDDQLVKQMELLRQHVLSRISRIREAHAEYQFDSRGRGLMQGLDIRDGKLARRIIDRCFGNGLIIEGCGVNDEVLKLMPALNTPLDVLLEGLDILEQSVGEVLTPPVVAGAAPVFGVPNLTPLGGLSADAMLPSEV
jgi:diaminobutyrate-2-oxoglutarate transaminase